ncbi:stromal cell-derived factor 2 [Galleria mellonella]|uniref:Stromal cell-derived factor 2 n=1 Tax=Galleria mellonella TaxID=7137 RepID=A0A6J1X980_GALME|nr:stromal cell-derived factor 2 [Galleria mellonella]XP_026764668.1 stromal cell-derived factor 2 [Galleria mellonella]
MDFIRIFCVFPSLLLILLFYSLFLIETSQGSKAEYVTCGTILKLMNTDLRLRLHSHDVKYGSGSGQQSVTAVDTTDDHNSHWLVKAASGESCKRGAPIKCNSVVRLQHISTKKNLHSHYFSSPLSGNQEVSCYGDDDGEGDSGDNWTVVCNNDFWRRDTPVKLKHVDTASFLAGSGRTFGRPISGQGEIVGVTSQYGAYTDWQAKEGLFVHPSDPLPHQQHAIHTEL